MTNVPVPGDTTVPSARAERRRMQRNDLKGIGMYIVAVACVAVALLIVTVLA